MKTKHISLVILISCFGIVFISSSLDDFTEMTKAFDTNWFDAIEAIFIGLILGLMLRIESIRNYINTIPFGTFLTGVGIGIIGLGAIGMGFIGAAIIYLKFYDIELIRVPLHASVVGLSAFCIYLVSMWKRTNN